MMHQLSTRKVRKECPDIGWDLGIGVGGGAFSQQDPIFFLKRGTLTDIMERLIVHSPQPPSYCQL